MQLPLPSHLHTSALSPGRAAVKRAFDIAAASGGLIATAPIVLAAALGARRYNGKAIYAHQRIGLYGRPFRLYKICSMRSVEGISTTNTASNDPRITPFGRFIRKWKIDELPQLWNVLKGEMSLVGPRPDVAEFFSAIPESAADMLRVRPGITSPLSVELVDEEALLAGVDDPDRYYLETLFPLKATRNVEYVRHQSLALDLKTLLATLLALGRRRR